MIICKICGKETTNRVYCSELCQYQGYRTRQSKLCEVCQEPTFNLRFCSSKCYSETNSNLRKEKITKDGHHNKGRRASETERAMRSEINKKLWENPYHREKMLKALSDARNRSEYPLGWDPDSIKKRKETNLIRFGTEHNWNGKYGSRKSDITFKLKYGVDSITYLFEKLLESKNEKTSIERIVENILIKYNINYIYQYKFKNRYFDFCLPDYDILIECDGDYFHAKDVPEHRLNELQRRSVENDKYKDSLVLNDLNFHLIRFWGSEIESAEFEYKLIALWQK